MCVRFNVCTKVRAHVKAERKYVASSGTLCSQSESWTHSGPICVALVEEGKRTKRIKWEDRKRVDWKEERKQEIDRRKA